MLLILLMSCLRSEHKLYDVSSSAYVDTVTNHLCQQWTCFGWTSIGSCYSYFSESPLYDASALLCYDSGAMADCLSWMDDHADPSECLGLPHDCQPAALATPCSQDSN
jgi:hypothetical protein